MFKTINGGQLPQRATRYSAGFDMFANEDVVIGAGETVTIGLGICLDINRGILDIYGDSIKVTNPIEDFSEHYDYLKQRLMKEHYLELHPRSSLRAKGLGGGVGIIDMDYRDEIKMVIHNAIYAVDIEDGCNIELGLNLRKGYDIKKGDKIGQLILKRHEGWLLPSEYTKDEERNGGFGSTGGIA